MGLFSNQFSNVVEWQEEDPNQIFYKWSNNEIKKGSRLIIRPGQDAIFLYQGKIEGIFEDEGDYDISSDIVPFLSTLKGFKFGFNSGIRAEVLFVNTKEFTIKWGTKQPVNIPTQQLPGGMPIRANGTLTFKIKDYNVLIDRVAGIKKDFYVEDVKVRITSVLDQLLTKWIVKEGKDMFNLQANSYEISNGIKTDLNMKLYDLGLGIVTFTIGGISYPDSIQKMVEKNASYSMVGDVDRYQRMSMVEGLSAGGNSNNTASNTAKEMTAMMMGMQMANQMVNNMRQPQTPYPQQQSQIPNSQIPNSQIPNSQIPNFCPNCGQKTTGANFCPNCGNKLC